MSLSYKQFFLSTYERAIISNWRPLTHWILQKTQSDLKEKHDPSNHPTPNLLLDEQIYAIISGPYRLFLQHHLNTYAIIIYAKQQHILTSEDLFKDYENIKQNRLSEAEIKTIESYNLKEMQQQLSDILNQQDAQWTAIIDQWEDEIINQLKKLQLTEQERELFKAYEPLTEINNRFNDLNIKPPKYKKGQVSFADLLKLKTYLVIHSALSRQHSPNTDSDIQTILKSLKKIFEQIHSQDKQLNEQQYSEMKKVVEPLSFIQLNKKS